MSPDSIGVKVAVLYSKVQALEIRVGKIEDENGSNRRALIVAGLSLIGVLITAVAVVVAALITKGG